MHQLLQLRAHINAGKVDGVEYFSLEGDGLPRNTVISGLYDGRTSAYATSKQGNTT